jgi:CBS domain-containing protein
MIVEPIMLHPSATLREAEQIMSNYHISGVPIVDDEERLLGILTNRDIRFIDATDYHLPVSQFMTPQPLVTARVGISLEDAKQLLQKHKIENAVVDERGGRGLITTWSRRRAFPYAAKDSQAAGCGKGWSRPGRAYAATGKGRSGGGSIRPRHSRGSTGDRYPPNYRICQCSWECSHSRGVRRCDAGRMGSRLGWVPDRSAPPA